MNMLKEGRYSEMTTKNFFVKFFSIFVKQFINSLKTKLLC
mgnify:CR=1 FL=1